MPFNQMMNFPVELTLRTTDEGIRMFAEPVKEIALLHAKKHAWHDTTVEPGGKNLLEGVTGDLFHIKVECTPGGAQRFGLNIRGVPIVCDVAKQELIGKNAAPLKPIDGRVRLEMLVDRTSIEVFGNDGRVYMPLGVIPADDNRTLEVFAEGGPVKVNALEVVELRSAWE
jgi:sucrose-6-phosphate hydrolase SacC (GH32 family)